MGEKTTYGTGQILFGGGGPIYVCSGQQTSTNWADDFGRAGVSTFFQFEFTALSSDQTKGSGNFACVAANSDQNSGDDRLLIITGGTFALTTD